MLPSQQLFEGLDFQAYGSVPAKRPFRSCFKHVYAGGAKQQGVLLEMSGEALRVDFPIATLPTSNMNQQISLLMFIRYTLHRKSTLTKLLFDMYF